MQHARAYARRGCRRCSGCSGCSGCRPAAVRSRCSRTRAGGAASAPRPPGLERGSTVRRGGMMGECGMLSGCSEASATCALPRARSASSPCSAASTSLSCSACSAAAHAACSACNAAPLLSCAAVHSRATPCAVTAGPAATHEASCSAAGRPARAETTAAAASATAAAVTTGARMRSAKAPSGREPDWLVASWTAGCAASRSVRRDDVSSRSAWCEASSAWRGRRATWAAWRCRSARAASFRCGAPTLPKASLALSCCSPLDGAAAISAALSVSPSRAIHAA